MEFTKGHINLLKAYCRFLEKNRSFPTRKDLMEMGYNRDKIRHYFSNLENLEEQARDYSPDSFTSVIDESLFSAKSLKTLKDNIKKHKRFVIVTAVTGASVDESLLDGIRHYCKTKNAMLLVLPASDPAKAGKRWTLDSRIGKESVVFCDVSLNSNVFLSSVKLSAKHIDPITSLDRIGQRNGTFIYASPKQRLKFVSVSNAKYPHALMTTGAITVPDYYTTRYMSERTAKIATHDHVMGGIILEIVDDKRYHFRQFQSDKDGGFVDLGEYYKGDTVTRMDAAAFVMGDWHSGETDPMAKKAWKEVCSLVKPDYIMIHDGFNGKSISHHDKGKRITMARLAESGLLSLEKELRQYAQDLDELQSWVKKKAVVVRSNHDVFLERWLEDGEYDDDPYNYHLGVKLADVMVDGTNPLKWGVEQHGLKHGDRVQFLEKRQDFIISGIQLSAHGHKGSNGAKGSLMSMEKGYGQSVSGHSHTPEILRGAWQVGTTSLLQLDYNSEGLSSWLHCSCIVYPNGSRQLINAFEGSWKL